MENEAKKERPQDRYNKKNNLAAKTYRLNKDIAERFKEACDIAGVSQASQLTKMMQEFVERVENGNG